MKVNNSRARVSLSIVVVVVVVLSHSTSSSPFDDPVFRPYAGFCGHVVPESQPVAAAAENSPNLRLYSAFFSGGAPLLSTNASARSSSLQIKSLSTTRTPGTLYVTAVLSFWGSDFLPGLTRRGLRMIVNRPPRWQRRGRRNTALFLLQGFYSEETRRLCMIGNGLGNLQAVSVVLNLNYPNVPALDTSIVSGTLVGTNTSAGLSPFKPISILGFSMMNYTYKYVDDEVQKGVFRVYDNTKNVVGFDSFRRICAAFRPVSRFELQYLEGRKNVGCSPLDGNCRSLPEFMSLNEIDCGGKKARYVIDFSNLNFNGRRLPFHPNMTLVAEGAWNEKGHFDLVACRFLNVNDSITKVLVGDCSIRLSFRFPASLSLRYRSAVVGLMWSSRKVGDQGYFGKIAFQSPTNGNTRVQGLKYVYTVGDNATRVCSKKVANKHKGGKYPDGFSSDLRFDMIVKDGKGQNAWGYSSPLSVGDHFYKYRPLFALSNNSQGQTIQTGILNVSYIMSFNPPPGFNLGGDVSYVNFVEISAEGTYDPTTGSLCMLGCRHVMSPGKKVSKNETLDCDLVINIQYSSLKSKVGNEVKGTIESNRPKEDPLYFDRLELSATSLFSGQAQDSIWTMDLEITMVLISNTLMCIFVILQLLYVKRCPDVLPFISLVMLTVLTLAQLIPLVLNFEALFMVNRNKQNVFLSSGGWVEVNEVVVRVITMIAFLLEFRLLQQAWSSRLGDVNLNALWICDKKVLYFSIPLYIGGALIAWVVHQWKHTYNISVLNFRRFGYHQHNSFWLDFKSYAGLILDGFLLPQIAFNVFSNTREKALTPFFYIGTTVVRLLPHAYDLYRAHMPSWYSGGIYADPGMDYYSTMWDIAISVGGLVFIVLVYLQQRFGGRCILPKRFRESIEYEKVSVISTELSPRGLSSR